MPEGHRSYNDYPGQEAVGNTAISIETRCLNPGLLLDRLAFYHQRWDFDQQSQHDHLNKVIQATPRGDAAETLQRWDTFVAALPGARATWCQPLLWRLALHLSRATAVENGSICLHPTYGFAYLPGTGLKGLARAYAELSGENQEDIARVFGPATDAGEKSRGSVMFLDAWPDRWPNLELDIVNVHHREYYSSKGESPPGDWESPSPSYFLTVAPGVSFRFTVATRDPRSVEGDLNLAQDWLQKGLEELGAGAKTAAGYGYFGEVKAWEPNPAASSPLEAFRQGLQHYAQTGCDKRQRNRLWPLLDQVLASNPDDLATALKELRKTDPRIVNSPKFQAYQRER